MKNWKNHDLLLLTLWWNQIQCSKFLFCYSRWIMSIFSRIFEKSFEIIIIGLHVKTTLHLSASRLRVSWKPNWRLLLTALHLCIHPRKTKLYISFFTQFFTHSFSFLLSHRIFSKRGRAASCPTSVPSFSPSRARSVLSSVAVVLVLLLGH
jgi:hypothetical protein